MRALGEGRELKKAVIKCNEKLTYKRAKWKSITFSHATTVARDRHNLFVYVRLQKRFDRIPFFTVFLREPISPCCRYNSLCVTDTIACTVWSEDSGEKALGGDEAS